MEHDYHCERSAIGLSLAAKYPVSEHELDELLKGFDLCLCRERRRGEGQVLGLVSEFGSLVEKVRKWAEDRGYVKSSGISMRWIGKT